jgi:YgiT-type zinc finger domain-containing protein
MKAGLTRVTLERDGTNIVIHKVPADVCETRGEDYVDPAGAASLETSFTSFVINDCASRSIARLPSSVSVVQLDRRSAHYDPHISA